MILAMLSNLLLASSLISSCLSCFTVNILKDFPVIAIAREKTRLVPLNVIPTGRPALINAAVESPPVITANVIRPVSTMLVIVSNHFIFFLAFQELQFHQVNMPEFMLPFSSDKLVGLMEP